MGRDDPHTAEVLGELAESYGDIGRIPEAEATASDALARLARAGGVGSPQAMNILRFEGDMYNFLDRSSEAEEAYRRAIEIGRKALGPGHPAFAIAQISFGEFQLDRGHFAEAQATLREAVGVLEPMGTMDAATGLLALSRSLREQESFAEAEALARRAEAFSIEHGGPDHIRVWLSRIELVSIDLGRERTGEAERLARDSLAAFTGSSGREARTSRSRGSSWESSCANRAGSTRRSRGTASARRRRSGRSARRRHDAWDSPALGLALDLMARRQGSDLAEARRVLDAALAGSDDGSASSPLYRGTLEASSGRLALLEGDRARARRDLHDAVDRLAAALPPDAPSLVDPGATSPA